MTEQELREMLQPMFRDELMRTWHEGVRDGLKMALKMAKAVRNECARRTSSDRERIALEAQIVVLDGLMNGFLEAGKEAVNQEWKPKA